MGKFSGLVGEDSFAGVVYLGVHVAKFSAFELGDWKSSRGMGFGLVEQTFFLLWLRWPLGVSTVSGKYFWMLRTVSNGHPMKLPAWTALIQVDFTGYPHTACIHLMACSVDGKS